MFEKMKQLAEKKHDGQFRLANKGELPVPYFKHPESVACCPASWL